MRSTLQREGDAMSPGERNAKKQKLDNKLKSSQCRSELSFWLEVIVGTYDGLLLGWIASGTAQQKRAGEHWQYYGDSCEQASNMDTNNGLQFQQSFTTSSNQASVRCLTLSQSGRNIIAAAGSDDETVNLVSFSRRCQIGQIYTEQAVSCVEFYGKYLLEAGSNGINIYSGAGQRWDQLASLQFDYVASRKRAASRGNIGARSDSAALSAESPSINDTQTRSVHASRNDRRTVPKGTVSCVAVHPSGRLLLCAHSDKTLTVWNLVRGRRSYSTKLPFVCQRILWLPSMQTQLDELDVNKNSKSLVNNSSQWPAYFAILPLKARHIVIYNVSNCAVVSRICLPGPGLGPNQMTESNLVTAQSNNPLGDCHVAPAAIITDVSFVLLSVTSFSQNSPLTLMVISTDQGDLLTYKLQFDNSSVSLPVSSRVTSTSPCTDVISTTSTSLFHSATLICLNMGAHKSRIKCLKVVSLSSDQLKACFYLLLSASSDGCIQLWDICVSDSERAMSTDIDNGITDRACAWFSAVQLRLIGQIQSQFRLTCLEAYAKLKESPFSTK